MMRSVPLAARVLPNLVEQQEERGFTNCPVISPEVALNKSTTPELGKHPVNQSPATARHGGFLIHCPAIAG